MQDVKPPYHALVADSDSSWTEVRINVPIAQILVSQRKIDQVFDLTCTDSDYTLT